jgi:hypothetical protein
MTTIITGIIVGSIALYMAHASYEIECEAKKREADGWIRF